MSFALIVVSRLSRRAASHIAADGASFSWRVWNNSALRSGFVLRGQLAGVPILTLRQRLCRLQVAHWGNVRHRAPDRNAPSRPDVFIAYECGRTICPACVGTTLASRPLQ